MIDPLETVIQYLKGCGLSTNQIAGKQRYGEAWAIGSAGISVSLDGGTPNLDLPVQDVRLEVHCYGASQYEALSLTWEIVERGTQAKRVEVATHNGKALLYWLLPESSPATLYDPDLKMDFVLQFYSARVAEQEITYG